MSFFVFAAVAVVSFVAGGYSGYRFGAKAAADVAAVEAAVKKV